MDGKIPAAEQGPLWGGSGDSVTLQPPCPPDTGGGQGLRRLAAALIGHPRSIRCPLLAGRHSERVAGANLTTTIPSGGSRPLLYPQTHRGRNASPLQEISQDFTTCKWNRWDLDACTPGFGAHMGSAVPCSASCWHQLARAGLHHPTLSNILEESPQTVILPSW